jgi:hypothetical protein
VITFINLQIIAHKRFNCFHMFNMSLFCQLSDFQSMDSGITGPSNHVTDILLITIVDGK